MRTMSIMILLVVVLASCAQTPAQAPAPQQVQVQPPSAAQNDIGKVEAQEEQVPASPSPAVVEPEPLPQTHLVKIQAYAFSPKTLNIRSGDKVTWRNLGKTPHEIMGLGFQSQSLFQDDEYSHIFTQKGNHTYNSARYPATIGKIIVQ